MSKKKLTDKQQELLTLLPDELPTLSQAAQLVLANIIFKYGTEYAREHGYIFRTNEDMVQDTGLSKQSVITAVRQLEMLGLIESVRGRRGQASEYYLSDEIKQKINFASTEINDKTREMVVERNTSKGQINETMGQITKGQITELISQITDAVCERMNDIITLKFKELSDILVSSTSHEIEPYLTTDIEKEIDKEILNNINQDIDSTNGRKTPSQMNQYVNKVFEWLDTQLDYLFKVKDESVYYELSNTINQYIDSIDKSQFTNKQWGVVVNKIKRWAGIEEAKNKYFNRQRNKVSDSSMDNTDNTSMDDVTINDDCNTSISLNDYLSENGSVPQKCRDFSNEEVIEWVSNEVKEYSSYELWEKHTINSFNRKFCEDWDKGYDANAMSLFYTACEIAEDYFQKMDERELQVDDDDLAPWETIDGRVFQSV